MNQVATWIAGLMRENYEAIGFIPLPTIEQRYIRQGRYVLQHDGRGHPVGYLLHGAMHYGSLLSIAQHCIQHDSRLRGYGKQAFLELRQRAAKSGVSAITVRCAMDLESLVFWQAQGFLLRDVVTGGIARQRRIARLVLPLCLPLFDAGQVEGVKA